MILKLLGLLDTDDVLSFLLNHHCRQSPAETKSGILQVPGDLENSYYRLQITIIRLFQAHSFSRRFLKKRGLRFGIEPRTHLCCLRFSWFKTKLCLNCQFSKWSSRLSCNSASLDSHPPSWRHL